MKKNLLFLILMLAVTALLFMLRKTGMGVHIALSVLGLAILGVYTVLTVKEWKSPLFEILTRVFYLVALITGVILINADCGNFVSVLHKISAALFVIIFVVTEIHKNIKTKA